MAVAVAVAALRNLVTKIRIPVAYTFRALRAPRAQAVAPLPPLPPPPKGDLESALLLKNKIQTAEAKELYSNGDLIAQRCEETEEILSYYYKKPELDAEEDPLEAA